MDLDTRDRILNAAGKLFGEVGYTRTTTRAIAAEAGVNEVTLFRHFNSKPNLLKAFVEQFNAEGFPGTFEDQLTGSYPDDIRAMAKLSLEAVTERFQLLRIMLCDLFELPELRDLALAGARQNTIQLVRYFQQQIDAGVIRADLQPEAVTEAFGALFSTSIIVPLFFQTDITPGITAETLLAQMADIFVQGTINHPASTEGN
ncbi:MAG TPA: TetR/AcrR family transcriptional regulator [Phototrophicaceae bacterium]|nr:TetR/AcrR family transcriptional regulator [Phototrophicaceae bacterium]